MLKFFNTDIVFQEIPDETTLAINLTGCPCRCPGCHSPHLWADTGTPLTPDILDTLVGAMNDHISCVCFMGGDAAPHEVAALAAHLHATHPRFKTAWYSGRQYIPHSLDRQQFDYIKVGPYIAHLGPLTSPRTNQRMLRRQPDGTFADITARFRKHTS